MRRALPVVLLVIAAAFAIVVWPTPYRYFASSTSGIPAVRQNRFTGSLEYLGINDGWTQIAPKSSRVGKEGERWFADKPVAPTPDRLDSLLTYPAPPSAP